MLNLDLARRFAELDALQKKLKEELSSVLKELAAVEKDLLDHMASEGASEVKLANGTKVRVTSLVWAKILDKIEAAKVLKATGFADYVQESFNKNKISTLLREHINAGKDLPVEFEGVIEANEVFKLRANHR